MPGSHTAFNTALVQRPRVVGAPYKCSPCYKGHRVTFSRIIPVTPGTQGLFLHAALSQLHPPWLTKGQFLPSPAAHQDANTPRDLEQSAGTRRTPSTSKNHHGAGDPLTSFNLSHLRLNKDKHPPLPSLRGRGRHRSNAFLGLSCVFSLLRGCPSTCAFGNEIKLGYHTATMPDT